MSMTNSEIILELIKENLAEVRHNTEHRKEVTQFIFTIGGAIGIAVTSEFLKLTPFQNDALGWVAICFGLLGAAYTRKLHERQIWYNSRTEQLYKKLDSLQGELNISELYADHQKKHKNTHKMMSKWRTNWLWFAINFSVTLLGIGILWYK